MIDQKSSRPLEFNDWQMTAPFHESNLKDEATTSSALNLCLWSRARALP
jgi:hypothetical protein